ncbi:DUF350 domain-containing protein [Actinophytocola sp. NPDC049390]|uniref:DUF350 domain-containing protein n=1 Tax=Actinophytocola sp. NPDC049390 TaxID=3363894 RepID=UPI00378FB51C
MNNLLNAMLHAVVYAFTAGALLVAAYYVLDLITPGHLGRQLRGDPDGDEETMPSQSAGVVAGAWTLSNALVLFTAIWTNGQTDLGTALLWTVAFGALGIVLNIVMFLVVEALTPGRLREIVCTPGPVRPLAVLAAAASLSVAGIVCASIA